MPQAQGDDHVAACLPAWGLALVDLASVGALGNGDGGLALTLLLTVFLAGFRHGFDIDHVAAISDIASASPSRRTAYSLATAYATGHMVVVFVLGAAAVFAGDSIPASWDAVAGRIIGASLIWLGVYVAYSVVRHGGDFRMKSRWMLLVAGARRGLGWMRSTPDVVIEHDHKHPADGHHHHPYEHEVRALAASERANSEVATRTRTHTHTHRHVAPMPPDPFAEYSPRASFVIGMIHGVGAETPTQILLFTTAAGLAGALGGVTLVALFVLGLLLGNTVLAVLTVTALSAGRRLPLVYLGLATTTGMISIGLGFIYLFDAPLSL